VRVCFDIAGRRVLADDGGEEGSEAGGEGGSSGEGSDGELGGGGGGGAGSTAGGTDAEAAATDAMFAQLRGDAQATREDAARSALLTGPLAQYSCLPAEDTSSCPETLAGAGQKTDMLGNRRSLANNALTGRAREVFQAISASAPATQQGGTRPGLVMGRRLQHEVAF
jgi:hypothetical protein